MLSSPPQNILEVDSDRSQRQQKTDKQRVEKNQPAPNCLITTQQGQRIQKGIAPMYIRALPRRSF